jgi:hypothetical protein
MKKSLILVLCFIQQICFGQQVPIGQWRTHLPYQRAQSVSEDAENIYCATTGGLFSLNKATNELKQWSTIDNLSGVNTKLINYSSTTSQLFIAYQNSKIDLLVKDDVFKVNDIFARQGLGNKSINAVTFKNQFAYLSMGFGIVVYDLNRREVKDTYFIGPNGSNIEVLEIAILDEMILALTSNGILENNINNPQINNANTWLKHANNQIYPNSNPLSITTFNGFVYGLFSNGIYKYNKNTWQLTSIFSPNVKRLKTSNGFLLSIADFRLISYNNQENIVKNIQNTAQFNNLQDGISSVSGDIYLTDGVKGLIKVSTDNQFINIKPNGPNTNAVQNLNAINNQVILSPGTISQVLAPSFNFDGFSVFENEEWKSYDQQIPNFIPVRDIVNSSLNTENQTFYLNSYFNGLIEFNPDHNFKIYNQNNSSLQTTIGDAASIRTNGVALDANKNVWVTQYGVQRPLSRKTPDGQWNSFSFSSVISSPSVNLTGLLLDFDEYKWMPVRNDGIVIFDGSVSRKLGFNANNGGLPGSNVNCLTLDREGAVWIGTNQGVAVAFNTNEVFRGANVEIPNIIDGQFLRPILATENINCIAVDGANRKWIGTNNGVWLFSADGSQQISFFNQNNSPLIDNNIISIAIDTNIGEVFIGTASGIISYRGDATAPVSKMSKITVFPNPVRPNFIGTIGIKGLSENAIVKITDINGSLVYQTNALGGQANWDGRLKNGDRVGTGVYLVLVVNKDGTDTAVSKILFVK